MVAKQATILALWSPYGNQFNPAVTGLAFGTGDIGFLHGRQATTLRPQRQLGGPGFTCNRAPCVERTRLVGGALGALRELADHGVDLRYYEVGCCVLNHVPDLRQHDQSCIAHRIRERP